MKELNKRLIVSDFDGTLLTDEQTVPEKVRSAIAEYVAAGGIFAVCTGRMLRSILPRVRELGLKGLVVAYQGTVIAEIESGKILKKDCLNYGDAAEICLFIESLKQHMNTYSDEVLYTDLPRDDFYLKHYENRTGVNAELVNIPMSEFVRKNELNCQKVTCLVAPEEREGLYRKLLHKFGTRFDVTCSADVLVEISPMDDNKGEALKFLARHFGIPLEASVAVGDNLNDLSMVKTAGVGVAVGNAVDALKEAADFVSVTNNEGAVAQIIEKFGFK